MATQTYKRWKVLTPATPLYSSSIPPFLLFLIFFLLEYIFPILRLYARNLGGNHTNGGFFQIARPHWFFPISLCGIFYLIARSWHGTKLPKFRNSSKWIRILVPFLMCKKILRTKRVSGRKNSRAVELYSPHASTTRGARLQDLT